MIRTYKNVFLLFSLLIVCAPYLKAQEEVRPQNAIYGSLGTTISSNQVSLAYERMLFSRNEFQTKAKLNIGTYLSNNADYEDGARVNEQHYSISAVQILNIFELNIGLAYTEFSLAQNITGRSELMNSFEYYASFGVRYERNKLVLRGGIGNFELLYLSAGVSF